MTDRRDWTTKDHIAMLHVLVGLGDAGYVSCKRVLHLGITCCIAKGINAESPSQAHSCYSRPTALGTFRTGIA